VTSFTSDCGWF